MSTIRFTQTTTITPDQYIAATDVNVVIVRQGKNLKGRAGRSPSCSGALARASSRSRS
jgi:hypothetical protein